MLVLISSPNAYASRHYERDFIGYSGSGTVTVDVPDKIVFTITVTSGYDFFCFTPESIIQGQVQYYITEYPSEPNDITILWQNFDGCNDIHAGITAIGTMNIFPSSFNIWGSFRIYCGIWDDPKYDYFDVAANSIGQLLQQQLLRFKLQQQPLQFKLKQRLPQCKLQQQPPRP